MNKIYDLWQLRTAVKKLKKYKDLFGTGNSSYMCKILHFHASMLAFYIKGKAVSVTGRGDP
jgi:hypothetical protein